MFQPGGKRLTCAESTHWTDSAVVKPNWLRLTAIAALLAMALAIAPHFPHVGPHVGPHLEHEKAQRGGPHLDLEASSQASHPSRPSLDSSEGWLGPDLGHEHHSAQRAVEALHCGLCRSHDEEETAAPSAEMRQSATLAGHLDLRRRPEAGEPTGPDTSVHPTRGPPATPFLLLA